MNLKTLNFVCLALLISFSIIAQDNIILIGPPGCGKGTFSQYAKNHNYEQIGTGDLLREEIRSETELGKQIKPIVEAGDYVEESIVNKIMFNKIKSCITKSKLFILDGFIRSKSNLAALINFLKENNITNIKCLALNTNDQICLNRIISRIMCFDCHNVYSVNNLGNNLICPNCDSELSQRMSDQKETTIKRLKYYRENIEPLIKQIETEFQTIKFETNKNEQECLDFYNSLIS